MIARACPNCGYVSGAISAVADNMAERPSPGAISICVNCALVEQFGPSMVLRALTPDEFKALDAETLSNVALTVFFIVQRGRFYPKRPPRG